MHRSAVALTLVLSSFALAQPRHDDIPASLREWVPWVMHGETTAGCPFMHGSDTAPCAWPGRLSLSLEDKSGRFTQSFRVYREAWLRLPGALKHWPQNVQVDGRAAVVVPGRDGDAAAGSPTVLLTAGEHTVTGDFLWDALPEAVEIPPDTGLLSLSLKGKPVPLPNRDPEGRVFLQKETTAQETDRVELTVHRMVDDDIPMWLTTSVELKVSGKSREVLLGRALPDGFVPSAMNSPLPARIESDGKLRLQVRPGTWTVEVKARHDGPVTSLKRPEPDGLWADEDEVWVFAAKPSLRQVLVEGVNAVDPQQTTLPGAWRAFPSYAMALGDTMQLTERRRGDADPAPDSLHLTRTLWLDFEGTGYTVSDRISGTLHRSWRLDMLPRTELGRVVAAGADQSITKFDVAPAGVELREGGLALEAEERISGDISTIPAVSWDADFASVNTTLQLPPGWRLLAASGADNVPETWLNLWSLLDIFLVLVIAVAMGRLFGVPWGALALLTLVLTWHEEEVPRYVWLAVLVGEALLRVLPKNWLSSVVAFYRYATLATLVVMSVNFMVLHVRHGMYPALAQQRVLGGLRSYSEYSNENQVQYSRSANINPNFNSNINNAPAQNEFMDQDEEGYLKKELSDVAAAGKQAKLAEPQKARARDLRQLDKNARVQTGPGLPRWEWNSLNIGFSGPVQRAQQLELTLIGPRTNFVLAFVRVVLLALLALCVMGFPGSFWPQVLRRSLKSKAPAAAAMVLALVVGANAHAQTPEDAAPQSALLTELHRRLLEKPSCAPACASSPRLALEASPSSLRLRVEVLAGAQTAVPLPGNAQHWVPESVVVDGKPSSSLRREPDGSLWLAVTEGAHQVVMEGPMPGRDTVQIALPLKSYRVEAKLEGWSLDGLHEDGLADENLQLSRKANEKSPTAALQTGTLPSYVRVQRTLSLGLEWSVDTVVERLTPTGSAVVLEVPLLPGESVTSSDVRVQSGKALVNMPANDTRVSWSSVLEQKSPVVLSAQTGLPWVEVWQLDVGPMWHVKTEGIPVVHQQDPSGARMPLWRPWPGESVRIEVVRPEGVQGQTLTIDQSKLTVSPGVRATDVTFTANMRSSRGGLHPITLPEGAELQSVSINGAAQPIRQDARTVSIPLVPGSQSLTLVWRQNAGLETSWTTPELGLGTPAVNTELEVNVPADRWVLFLRGPRMGPAVLFWSFLLVLMAVSLGLGRITWAPLRARQWVLLALGLSQIPVAAIALVFAWLLLLGWRKKQAETGSWATFNLRQLLIVGATMVALGIIAVSVYEGLLGAPDMQIMGNGSTAQQLHWFLDRTDGAFPTGWLVSVPMLGYRLAMLGWSLWMAVALLRWLSWGWQAFSTGGLWQAAPKVVRVSVPAPKPVVVVPPSEPPKP